MAWAERTDHTAGFVANEPRLEAAKHQRVVDSDEYQAVMGERELDKHMADLLAQEAELNEHARALQRQLDEMHDKMASGGAEFAEVTRKADETDKGALRRKWWQRICSSTSTSEEATRHPGSVAGIRVL